MAAEDPVKTPPRWPTQLLRMLCDPELTDEIEGDLEELYATWVATIGVTRARRRYVWHALKFIRPFIFKKRKAMKNAAALDITVSHFKASWRNILRNKGFATINVVGLAMSFTCIVLIYALCAFHLRFDNFHSDASRIYRLNTLASFGDGQHWPVVPQPLGKAIRNDLSFTEVTARIRTYRQVTVALPDVEGTPRFSEAGIVAFTEAEYFDIFRYEGASPEVKARLREPNTVLITHKLAVKYFGEEEAINRILRITAGSTQVDFRIIGVLDDTRPNTDLRAQVFLSYENLKDYNAFYASDKSWGSVNGGMLCFVKLKQGVSAEEFNAAMPELVKKYYDEEDAKMYNFVLQPLAEVHVDTSSDGTFSRKYVWILGAIAFFLLAIASVNFVNLTSAQVLTRSREAGIRKVLGSLRSQLFTQFMVETAIIGGLAAIAALGAAYAAMPWLNVILRNSLAIREVDYLEAATFLTAVVVLVVLVAGSFPAMLISRFQPVTALKGKLLKGNARGAPMRRALIVVQFAIAHALIIGMMIISDQVSYSTEADLGFDKESIVMLPVPQPDPMKMKSLREQLAQAPGVRETSLCYEPPASQSNVFTNVQFDSREKEEPWEISMRGADEHYLSTFGLTLVAGRNLVATDSAREFLVNETLVKKLGMSNAEEILGKPLYVGGRLVQGPVVGVVRDFNSESVHVDIKPVCIMQGYERFKTIAIKLDTRDASAALDHFREVWTKTYPEFIFSYQFFDESVERFYETETAMLRLVEIFALLAIAISCLGLFGLVSFMTVQKTKEISIRKVLGANIRGLLWLFGREFVVLITVAFLVAAPLAGWVMDQWLHGFVYHIPLHPTNFLLALICTLLVATLTVSYHSLRAATANPVDALKSE